MIAVPTCGMTRLVTVNRIDPNVLADWIEASVMFQDEELSQAAVSDRLIEEEVCRSQDLAQEIVSDAWRELERRVRLCSGSYALEVESQWVQQTESWHDRPAHVFCLLLSIAPSYDWWVKEFGHDYTEQGELFELLTEQALKTLVPGWSTLLTGWNRTNTGGFKRIAAEVAEIVGNGDPNLDLWDDKHGKDMTLDVLLYRPFADGRQGFPYFLIQCASGANWEQKLGDPDLNVWNNILRPLTHPMRGFAVPFCFSEQKFHQSCVKTEGLFLDRCRLLGAGQTNHQWLPQKTGDRINEWAALRVEKLLDRSE